MVPTFINDPGKKALFVHVLRLIDTGQAQSSQYLHTFDMHRPQAHQNTGNVRCFMFDETFQPKNSWRYQFQHAIHSSIAAGGFRLTTVGALETNEVRWFGTCQAVGASNAIGWSESFDGVEIPNDVHPVFLLLTSIVGGDHQIGFRMFLQCSPLLGGGGRLVQVEDMFLTCFNELQDTNLATFHNKLMAPDGIFL